MKNQLYIRFFFLVLVIYFGNKINGQVSLTTSGVPYTQNFNAYTGSLATTPVGWSVTGTYRGQIAGSNCSNTQGGLWSFGSSGDFAFGLLRSGTNTTVALAVNFANNTGNTITSLTIAWDYRQYGGCNNSALDLSGSGGLAGNPTVNNASQDFTGSTGAPFGATSPRSFTLTGLTIASGANFGLGWANTDFAGADNGLAIDNFSITPFTGVSCTPPTLSNTPTNISCNGGTNGSIDLTTTGGSSPFTYAWTGPGSFSANTQDISGLQTGTYSVTVTATGGCTTTTTVNITEPTAISANISSSTNIICPGGSNGSATVSASGGTGALNYSWAPSGGTGTTASGLTAGNYTVTVTDVNGCTTNTSVSITEPAALNLTTTNTNTSCNGNNDGTIDLTVSGGTPNYTYNWSNSATSQDLLSLPVGTYDVTVTDANGCTASTSTSITEPVILNLTTTNTNISCNGANDGTIDLIVTGGTPNYTYSWSNSANTQDLSSLGVGTYDVTVTDANGCTGSTSASITEPGILNITTTNTNITCNGANNGSIDLTVTGGTANYTYNWNNSATTEDIASLDVGTYDVTVTDANGCATSTSSSITEPAVLNLSTTHTNVSCNGGNNGSIDLTVTGGTANYTYSWSNSANTQDISFLVVGPYHVTVTDANGCTASTSVSITGSSPLNLTNTHTNVSCNGGNNGSIDLTVTGGTPNYTYNWSNSATTQDISSLSALNYNVTVTDGNGCTATTSVNITEPTAINLSTTHINPGCSGTNNGSINLTVTGGGGSYTYLWNNSEITQDLSSLTNGTYIVTVTDGNNCTATTSVILTSQANLDLDATWTNASCNGGNNGSIHLIVNSGTPTYTYAWSNSATTQDIFSLSAGTYTVQVTDGAGCTGTYSQVIGEPGLITSFISVSVCVSYTSPSGLYTWTTSGLYTDTLTAVNGCDSLVGIDLAIQNPDVSVQALGHTFSANLSGASYQWVDCNNSFGPITGATAQTYISPVNGDFAVIVTESGCTDTSACYTTTNAGIEEDGFYAVVNLYPNPTNGAFSLSVEGLFTSNLTIDITDISGKQVYNSVIGTIEGTTTIPFELTNLREGIYLLRMNADNKSKTIRFIKNKE